VPSLQYPVIRSVRSNFDTFISSLPEVGVRAAELVVRANSLLSDTNLASLSQLVANLNAAGASLPGTLHDVGELVHDLRATVGDARGVLTEVQRSASSAGPNLSASMDKLRVTSENLAQASQRLDEVIVENRDELRSFARDGLPQIEALARDSRAAAREFQQLSHSLREDPSRLLYQPAASGLEIPR
jgi:ABC-type transporter Mla subunit MlaD